MENGFDPDDRLRDPLGVAQVSFEELDLARGAVQVLPPPRREVVEDPDAVPDGGEPEGEVASNEASPARNENRCPLVQGAAGAAFAGVDPAGLTGSTAGDRSLM